MQKELADERPDIDLQILAVNETGREDGLDVMAGLGDLPLLQDTAATNAWGAWGVRYRDVWFVDGQNRRVGVVNVTESDLSQPANREALKALIVRAASR